MSSFTLTLHAGVILSLLPMPSTPTPVQYNDQAD